MSGVVAAIDVGGSKIAGALLGRAGIVDRVERPTPGPPRAGDPGSRVAQAVAAELAEAAALRGRPVTAVGLGCCEYVHDGRLTSREVLAWSEQPADWLAEVFPGVPVRVESDVRCGLEAERVLGAARAVDSAVFVSWGTGISSSALVDGRVWSGSRGRAIALGELPAPSGFTLEQFASGAGMVNRWRVAGGWGAGVRELLTAACGQAAAGEIARSAGQALAEALTSVVRLLDPERLVLGGGLGATDHPARRALMDAWTRTGSLVPLVPSELGADGPLLGAALTAGWCAPPAGLPVSFPRPGTGRR